MSRASQKHRVETEYRAERIWITWGLLLSWTNDRKVEYGETVRRFNCHYYDGSKQHTRNIGPSK